MTIKPQPLNREGFLKRVVVKEVRLDEESSVCIRALPAKILVEGDNDSKDTFATANLLVNSLCDANGQLLFADGEKDQALSVDHVALRKLIDAIIELNGLKSPVEGETSMAEKN